MDSLLLQPDVVAVGETGRRKNDAYLTPTPLAEFLIHLLVRDGFWTGGSVLEPSAGGGAFVLAMEKLLPTRSQAIDIDPVRVEGLRRGFPKTEVVQADFTARPWEHFSLIAGNPPFNEAEKHVRHALAHRTDRGTVAFLLRLAFLETKERWPFWHEFPASKVYVLSQRPSFTGGGTDNCAYGWMVWRRGWSNPTELEVVSWR